MQALKSHDSGSQIVEENRRLNEEEYNQRKITLASYPRALFIQLDAPCNQDCVFCSRPDAYRHFDLDDFRTKYAEKLAPAMERAERINLTGSGELLLLPKARENLEYFNQFRFAEKMFATNGSSLTPKMIDFIAGSGSRYVIHVSLHSADQASHAVMTQSNTFPVVRHNLEYLRSIKSQIPAITVNFIFVATTKNIAGLSDFITFAREFRADAVIVYYNYVYRLDQKMLSCYFDKTTTNKMLDLAHGTAQRTGMRVSLPPKFNQDSYAASNICGEAWSQMMINPEGDIITCDVAGDSRETILDPLLLESPGSAGGGMIKEVAGGRVIEGASGTAERYSMNIIRKSSRRRGATKSFMDAWNGDYYTRIRTRLASEGNSACSALCFRANNAVVNDFRSHFITRGKSEEDLVQFLAGT